MLEVRIKKKLRQFWLDVEFQAGNGCTGILGASGCGKSMTLKSIAGIETPDEGRISVNGRPLFAAGSGRRLDVKPQKRGVGYLFQNYALFPNMTVEENIGCGIKRGTPGRREKIGRMIERFGLNGLEKSHPGMLSGGQQQRAALARLLVCEPEALLLDEPFSAMDAYLREGLRLQLAQVIAGYEGSALLVTHDRDEAFQLCSRLILMESGKILEQGETRRLFERPKKARTARLTGCKNLSRIERLGPHTIRALDWGLTLKTSEEVRGEITYAGIRAHEFSPAEGPLSAGNEEEGAAGTGERMPGQADAESHMPPENLIPVGKAGISEMPFEWYITLENGLWWKTEKRLHGETAFPKLPPYLYVRPESILLLEGEL